MGYIANSSASFLRSGKSKSFNNSFEPAPADNYGKMKKTFITKELYGSYVFFRLIYNAGNINFKRNVKVSVIDFDDILSRFKFPLELTSLSSKKSTMAKETVNILIDILEDNHTGTVKKILETKIIREKNSFSLLLNCILLNAS